MSILGSMGMGDSFVVKEKLDEIEKENMINSHISNSWYDVKGAWSVKGRRELHHFQINIHYWNNYWNDFQTKNNIMGVELSSTDMGDYFASFLQQYVGSDRIKFDFISWYRYVK